jgi:hypothetical protein
MTTTLIWDERYFWFDTGNGLLPLSGCEPYPAFDSPETKRRKTGGGKEEERVRGVRDGRLCRHRRLMVPILLSTNRQTGNMGDSL